MSLYSSYFMWFIQLVSFLGCYQSKPLYNPLYFVVLIMYASWAGSYLCKRVNFNLSVFIAVLSFLLLSLLCGQKAAREVFCAGCIPDIRFHSEFHCIHVVWCRSSCFHFIWRMCSSMQLSWCSLWGCACYQICVSFAGSNGEVCVALILAFEVGLVLSWLSNLKNKLALWFLAC